jgi:type IV pilus assembly protein PilQ
MLKRLEIRQAAAICAFYLVFALQFAPLRAEAAVVYEISDIGISLNGETLHYTLAGESPPIYTVSERFAPFRVVVDIAGASLATSLQTDPGALPANGFVSVEVSDLKEQEPALMRFSFTLADSHDYAVERLGDNGLQIRMFPAAAKAAAVVPETTATAQAEVAEPAGATDATLDQLIDSTEQLLSQDPQVTLSAAEDKAISLKDEFSFSGYQRQRISVDFYKIDIHNVFRLFRQITDLNIIVDEAVQGSLTLALNDVPWDFALDIILNLMDLRKEERFNTIVIYPAQKEFVWPTRAEENLAFEADIEVIEEEALVIEKAASQPPEVVQAQELMAKARSLEKREDFEGAAELYIKALELWPDNTRISNRLATLHLVNLGMNAKALYYAKESLKKDPQDTRAALYAAIGAANMERLAEAQEYFAQAISGPQPMGEALLSFAAFSENNGQNDAALKLLDKFHDLHGETLETMVGKARLLDKLEQEQAAGAQYRAILASGFQMRPDLRRYIEGRLALHESN